MFSRKCRNDVPCAVSWLMAAHHPFEHPTINYYLVLAMLNYTIDKVTKQ